MDALTVKIGGLTAQVGGLTAQVSGLTAQMAVLTAQMANQAAQTALLPPLLGQILARSLNTDIRSYNRRATQQSSIAPLRAPVVGPAASAYCKPAPPLVTLAQLMLAADRFSMPVRCFGRPRY